ncbi:hypothetical protein HZY97_11055 [Sphingomonas sp. R-74633]|uniref:hypothetical protein n=1 Tax=Sphingomonas sp. R-74633 TaxID=2751188 RepID=UPI0015D3218B|nr:hypothetical protein [Sphingomonas sp. R-74633]NYT41298.1 hypothetical protein [Sphingomonas sp. R-74633]
MKAVKLAALVAGLVVGAGAAHAQTGPGNPVLVGSVGAPELKGPDDSAANIDKAVREERVEAAAKAKTARAVPAKPGDVTAGSEVRDSKGVVLGKVESVDMSAAVVVAEAGKVEVPLEAFGKNNKGLLLALTKKDFDAMVAGANKPAN